MAPTKKLPISIEPLVSSYSHHSHFFSITRSSDILSKYDAKVSSVSCCFDNMISGQFEIYNAHCNSIVDIENDEYNFVLYTDNAIGGGCFYQKNVAGNGSFIMKVDQLKAIHPWSNVGIMIADKKYENRAMFHINGEGYLIFEMFTINDTLLAFDRLAVAGLYGWMKLTKIDNRIEIFYSDLGQEWKKYMEYRIDLPEDFYIGILVSRREAYYDNWLYVNYIQLYYEKISNQQSIDFFMGVQRSSYDQYCSNPFIVEYSVEAEIINKMVTLSDFLMKCIEQGFYISLLMNNSTDERDLIYGYDANRKTFLKCNYSLPIDKRCSEISYKDINNLHIHNTIYLIKRIFPWYEFELNIITMINSLKEYIYAVNTHRKLVFYPSSQKRIYGIKIYDALCKNMNQNSSDIKIYKLLVEHKKIMKMRIRFLYNKDILDSKQYKILYNAFSDVEEKTINALKIFQKYILSGDTRLKKDIEFIFAEIKEVEITYIEQMICYLNKKCNVSEGLYALYPSTSL